MVNVLGTGENAWDETTRPLDYCPDNSGASIHWYGKSSVVASANGNITLVGNSMSELAPRLKTLANIGISIARAGWHYHGQRL